MLDYGLKDKTAIVTGANNPQGIGAATALAFAREGAKLVLVYQKIARDYDDSKTGENGADRYYKANAGDASEVEARLRGLGAQVLALEKDISEYLFRTHLPKENPVLSDGFSACRQSLVDTLKQVFRTDKRYENVRKTW